MTYLSSPYSHRCPAVREARFHAACRAAADLMRRGHVIFCPIAHSHPIAGMMKRDFLWEPAMDQELWKRQDAPYLEFCDRMIVLCLPGWHKSTGVLGEIQAMRAAGKPIEFMRMVLGVMQPHPRARRLNILEPPKPFNSDEEPF